MRSFPLGGISFSLDISVSCGQAFRWRKEGGFWYAPSPYGEPSVWKIRQEQDLLQYDGFSEQELIRYFALDHDLAAILAAIDCDPLIHQAVDRCRGLRIFRQDPWECLVSYICSSCSNIPGIQMRIENLARQYGQELSFEGKPYYTFPDPERLFGAGDLRSCRVGYRDAYICGAAGFAVQEPDWSKAIADLPYPKARTALCGLHGVGNKVADCVLLFAFEKLEAVPVDVWIERILRTKYLGGEKKLNYDRAGNFAREHFGAYAGYAQEYLFASRREISKKGE
jgi:N-glycosylase/DNA lyase